MEKGRGPFATLLKGHSRRRRRRGWGVPGVPGVPQGPVWVDPREHPGQSRSKRGGGSRGSALAECWVLQWGREGEGGEEETWECQGWHWGGEGKGKGGKEEL